jgi:hypothetical protein
MLEDDGDNKELCELESPKISEASANISEVMNSNDKQGDCDHFHLLHLQTCKTYVTKKCHWLLHPKKIYDYFKNTD